MQDDVEQDIIIFYHTIVKIFSDIIFIKCEMWMLPILKVDFVSSKWYFIKKMNYHMYMV